MRSFAASHIFPILLATVSLSAAIIHGFIGFMQTGSFAIAISVLENYWLSVGTLVVAWHYETWLRNRRGNTASQVSNHKLRRFSTWPEFVCLMKGYFWLSGMLGGYLAIFYVQVFSLAFARNPRLDYVDDALKQTHFAEVFRWWVFLLVVMVVVPCISTIILGRRK